jgi:phosphate transport system substrate-binding protein
MRYSRNCNSIGPGPRGLVPWIDSKPISLLPVLFFATAALAWQPEQVKRVYVEPFTTKTGSEALRADLIRELRKLKSVSIAESESKADAILGGGGEIWIAGYRSLNPRAGTSLANGTPVYAGYLSVELRDREGETLWSDLVTPGAASEDVSRELARRIAKDVAEALSRGLAAPPSSPLPQPQTALKGAGATFPFPVYEKWFTNYRRANPNMDFAYDAVGSEAGVRSLLKSDVDFAASDSPHAVQDLAPGEESKYVLFPSVIGAVVPIVNLPGIAGEIQFTPEALAGIYLGKIKKWNDPILRQANRGLRLPDLDIVVVHRGDGSGTSYAWTDYLSQTSAQWKTQVGAGLSPQWPTGRGASGNEGVAQTVKELGGSIGYVEFIYALRNHLKYGKVENRFGEFVAASLESIAVAVKHAVPMSDDLKISIVNSPGAGAYPIASFTWLVVPVHMMDEGKRHAMADFLKWMLGPGQTQAAALGYLGLPKDVVGRAQAAMEKLR